MPKKSNTKTVKTIEELYPYGYKRLEAARKFIWYVHNEAMKNIAYLCHAPRVSKQMWPRVESCFCHSYGLSKWDNKIYVQEEIVWDDKENAYKKDGLDEMYEDYLEMVLTDKLEEDEKGIKAYAKKYEQIAKKLQKETGTKAPVGEDYDLSGRRRNIGE